MLRNWRTNARTAFASYAEDRINGLVLYGDSPWDTKVLGEPIAVIKNLVGTGADDSRVLDQLLDEVLRHAANRGIHLLTCKVQPLQFAAIHALERHGFLLMDTLLDFLFDFSRTPLERHQRCPNGWTVCAFVWRNLRINQKSSRSLIRRLRHILADITQIPRCHLGRAQEFMTNGYVPPLEAGRTGFLSLRLTIRSQVTPSGKRRLRWKRNIPSTSRTATLAGNSPGFFWARTLHGAQTRCDANRTQLREALRPAGTRQPIIQFIAAR